MNLEIERKIKFWLSTISKVLIIALVVFKLIPFLMDMATDSSKEKTNTIVGDSEKQEDSIVSKQNGSTVVNIDIPTKPKSNKENDKPQETTSENDTKNESLNSKPITNSIGIFIFDKDRIDSDVARQLEKTILEEYTTKSIRSTLDLGSLQSGNIEGYHETTKICIGRVSYTFKNKLNTISCALKLDFDTYDTDTGLKLKEHSRSISRNGIGFSQEEARTNAIKKVH